MPAIRTACVTICQVAPGLLAVALQAGCWQAALALLGLVAGAVAWREREREEQHDA